MGVQDTSSVGTTGEGRRLEEELDRWVAAAVITAEQAQEIRRIEAEEAHQAPAPSRIPLVAEALGFLGGALTLSAGIVGTSRLWDRFSTPVRLTLVGVVAALLIVAGRVVRREGEPALAHLGSFLWALATGTAAFWAGLFAVDVLGWEGVDVVFLVGAFTLVVAAALWAWRAAPLQHLAMLAALAVTVGGIAGQVQHVGGVYVGTALWALGVTWVVLAWTRVVQPTPLGYAAGGALAIGAGMVLGSEGIWGDALAILTALTLLAASVPTRSMVLLWAGVAGVFVSVPATIFEHFGGSIGVPVALFLVGMALIGVAMGASRLVREVRDTPPKPPRFSPRRIAEALFGLVAVVVALALGLTYIQLNDVPSFPSLRRTPDAAIHGSIAFIRPDGSRTCVYVITADGTSGGRTLLCERNLGQGPGSLGWNPAGHVVAVEYGPSGPPQAVEIDPADGRVVARGTPENVPAFMEGKGFVNELSRSSDGAVLEFQDAASGKARLVLHPTSGTTRTLFTAQGPRDYRFESTSWSPDGRYAAVVDSEHRLLVIDVESSTPTARVLATNATSPAWSTWAR